MGGAHGAGGRRARKEMRQTDLHYAGHGEEESNLAKDKGNEKRQVALASSEVTGHFKERKYKWMGSKRSHLSRRLT